jgi:large subunit ribosomal protein L4
MPTIDILTIDGQKKGSFKLPSTIFAAKVNQPLMAQAIRVYLSNKRQASAQTKSRGEVIVSKRKIWRQKGTGRARHGSRNAPIFVGGAIAHGPSGKQHFTSKLAKKMKQASLFSALTYQLNQNNLLVIDSLDKLTPKTNHLAKKLKKLTNNQPKRTLVLAEPKDNLKQASRNLNKTKTILAKNLNTFQVLNAGQLVFTQASIKALITHYIKSSLKK